ncbi:MAG TPA: ATP-binding protein [Candidatus Saccharimonadales bacterium]|nr:ATP-binding protein [Candidatus Saccharimonadales bacterium]
MQSSGIDPEKLLFLDKRIVLIIRTTGLIFSLSLAAICLLIYKGYLNIPDAESWACLPIAGALIALGLMEALWNPYTKAKVGFYILLYMLIGVPLSVLVTGFSTMIFMGWTLLLMVAVIFFGIGRALFGYGLMILALIIWLSRGQFTAAAVFSYAISAIAVGILWLLVLNVWQLTIKTIREVETAQNRQNVERNQLLTLINSLNVAVLTVSSSGRVRLYNAALLNLLDTNDSLAGKPLADILTLEDNEGEPFKGTIVDAKLPFERDDLSMRLGDGEVIRLLISGAPIRGANRDGTEGYILLIRDITKTKSLEEERDEFISVISHELRTPVTIAEGTLSNLTLLLDKGATVKKLKPAVTEAHEQIIYLADMVNDLGTLSRAERGVGDEPETIELNQLLNEMYHRYLPSAQKKGLKLNLDVDPKLGRLTTSRLYLEEILQNLITNSIKYTESGSVTIGANKQNGEVEFAIKDTGIGISKTDQRQIFKKFYRSEDYRTRETSGTGLGLYVTHKLASKLHTRIDVNSRLNHGSTFSFKLRSSKKSA